MLDFFVWLWTDTGIYIHTHTLTHRCIQTHTHSKLFLPPACVSSWIDWILVGSELCGWDPKTAQPCTFPHVGTKQDAVTILTNTIQSPTHTLTHKLSHTNKKNLINPHASYPYYLDKSIHHVRAWLYVNIAFCCLSLVCVCAERIWEECVGASCCWVETGRGHTERLLSILIGPC